MLCADIMFINGILMLISLSRHIHFATVEPLASQTKSNIMKAIKSILTVYRMRGF